MSTADGRLEESVERLTLAFDVLSRYPPGQELAEVAAELGRTRFFVVRHFCGVRIFVWTA